MQKPTTPATCTRRTILVANLHAARWQRLALARARRQGTQVMLMEQLAARLAGGFCQTPGHDYLQQAVRACLQTVAMGELDGIRDLPGTPRAVLATLRKCWAADYDLQAAAASHPRIAALAALDAAVRAALPPPMRLPADLARAALARLAMAPRVLGELDVVGMDRLDPCWQPLLLALARVTPVRWRGGVHAVPDWLEGSAVRVERSTPMQASCRVVSAGHAAHEALEAMRWARQLLASGVAASEIAIAGVNTADYDEALQALSAESGLDLHFTHGRPVAATRDGQVAAALADALLHGPTRRRLRRCALAALPEGWARALPHNLALRGAAAWRKALARLAPADWPGGVDRTAQLGAVIELLLTGADGAAAAGAKLLTGRPLLIWRRALLAGPAEALLDTIAGMRQDDGLDSCTCINWMPAPVLAATPRRHVWLLGLNAGAWPRPNREDGLLPGHIVAARVLEPVPPGVADRQALDAIAGSCAQLVLSFARRDAAGRHASASGLLRGRGAAEYLDYHLPAPHAVSESDRLLGRPQEFRDSAQASSASQAWRDWQAADVTAHDGLVRADHPALAALVARVHSASSLKSLLRNPIAQLWEYGMKWQAPDAEDEPLELEPMQFGKLVHAVAEQALERLEADAALCAASAAQLAAAVQASLDEAAARWEREEAVPPAALWRHTLASVRQSAQGALAHGQGALSGARAFAEVPFGGAANGGARAPWDRRQAVAIPGAGLLIKGVIDRLDLSPDGRRAIVRDYKTGNNPIKASTVLDGGAELQRCLYAYAVRTLLPALEEVQASLLYTRALKEFRLTAPDDALDVLSKALGAARDSFAAGHALPGPDAGGTYDAYALLLPANAEYRKRKEAAVLALLGDAATIWEKA